MSTATEKIKQELVSLFMFDKPPFRLSYEYRTKWSRYKRDKPALIEMMKEGTVKLIETTSKTKLFEYTPKA